MEETFFNLKSPSIYYIGTRNKQPVLQDSIGLSDELTLVILVSLDF